MTESGGSVFPSLLLVLFIGLKLTGYVDWSWWWVMAPLWVGVLVAVAVALAAVYVGSR